jgi:hypothetical protein
MRASLCALAAVMMLVALSASPSAQRRGRNDNAAFGAPIATNTVLANPGAYFGKLVTISAAVEEILSKNTFVVDQQKAVSATAVKAVGKPILVIAPYMSGTLNQKNYFLMRGEIVKLDSLAVARMASEYQIDLAQEVSAKYQGQPVLLATSVLTSTYVDIAKKPIPAPTPADVSLTSAMKIISPAFNALRTAAQESKADVVTENAARLQTAFTETEAIWTSVSLAPAAKLALDARGQAASIAAAVAAGNWDGVKASAATLNQTCQSCHAAHRERQEDGTFRMKR